MTTFYLGDCLEVMKELSDNSVDCFICDLPYGQLSKEPPVIPNTENKHRKACPPTERVGCAWDVKIDLAPFWEQVKRLARNDHTPVLMFCNTRFGYDLIHSNPSWFRYDLVWDKGHGVSFLLANKMPMKSHEMVYVFSKAGAFYRRVDMTNKQGMRCPLSVIPIGGRSAGGHPTEKPEDLYEWLLRRYVPDNGTVLDPTAGSFNSCFVADRLGYTAIGIEKDEVFFDKAVKRLNG